MSQPQSARPTDLSTSDGQTQSSQVFELKAQEVHSDETANGSTSNGTDDHTGRAGDAQARPVGCEQASQDAVDAALPRRTRWAGPAKRKSIVEVRHCNPDELLDLGRRLPETVEKALFGFLRRYDNSAWMKKQKLYLQMASIVAAHEALHPVVYNDTDEYHRPLRDEFNAIGFLNCGMRINPQPGQPPFWKCHQPEYCKRCNQWERVQPAKDEFVAAFSVGEAWYSLSVICRSNPEDAGVKLEVGRDKDNQPIYEWLFRLDNPARFPKLRKFGVDVLRYPYAVSEGLYDFMHWLTDGRYFDGLHVFRDISFSFFPHPIPERKVAHTVNCHYHAYGNTSREFTPAEAQRMWFACVKLLFRASNDRLHVDYSGLGADDGYLTSDAERLYGYPDIALRPLTSVGELGKAINYAIKPFKLADAYLDGLAHGCPVAGLNYEFHEVVFESEFLLFGPPQGYAFGNMSQKSRHRYIGVPRPKKMSRTQIARYLKRLETGEAYAWEMERHENHLKFVEKQREKHEAAELLKSSQKH